MGGGYWPRQEIGTAVLGNLHILKETIQRLRSRLKDVKEGLGASITIMKGMMMMALVLLLDMLRGQDRVWGAGLTRRHLCFQASSVTLSHFISWRCNLTNPFFKRVPL